MTAAEMLAGAAPEPTPDRRYPFQAHDPSAQIVERPIYRRELR